jgi:outer membrane biosynthesis protein TonB
MLRAMRAEKRSRLASVSLPLSLAYLLSVVALPGCGKVKELLGEKEEAKVAEAEPKAAEEKAAPEEPAPEPAPVEEIPEKPPATGLDALLELVPDAGTEFAIVRDASVLVDYAEEAGRFLDGPMAKLQADPDPPRDLKEMIEGFNEFQKARTAGVGMVKTAGIKLDQGIAIVGGGKKEVTVYAADNPNALIDFIKAVDEAEAAKITCKKLEEKPGYNACSEDKAAVEAFKPKGDPAALRKALTEALPGIDLEKVNMVAHGKEGGDVFVAVTTTPGLVSMAVSGKSPQLQAATAMLKPTSAKLLAAVQPGAGFMWWNGDMSKASALAGGNTPPPLNNLVSKLTGEVLIGGSVEPAAIMMQASINDATAFSGLVDMAMAGKEDVPPEVPNVPGSKVVYEQADLTVAGAPAKALHVAVTDVPEAHILSSQTGLGLEGWMFAAGDKATLALGPGADTVAKLAERSGNIGPGAAAALPPALAESLAKNEVSFVVHLPVDALHGPVVRKLVTSALKNVPDAKPEQLKAGIAMFSPISTLTGWIAHRGDQPVVFIAIQGIGNRATNEGKAALDAAHAVADGADPATAFSGMAATYANSPRVSAYQARAGTLPGALAGSFVGAAVATAALAVPMATGARNEALADELGIKPPPEEPPKVAKKPKPKKPKDPKKPDKPKPGPGPVEPPKPKPDVPKPKPKPDVPKPKPGKKAKLVKPVKPGK